MNNAELYSDFKSGEKVGKIFTQKSYRPTSFMIRSENGKTANFLQLFC